VRVFELGRVYLRDPNATDGDAGVAGLVQPLRLGGLAYGPADSLQWGADERPVDFYDVKGDVEALLAPLGRAARFVPAENPALHPGRSARIELDGASIGWIGELHPRWRQGYELPQAPVLFELDGEALAEGRLPSYQPIARQQGAARDIAVVVGDAVTHEALMEAIAAAPTAGVVRSARLFDVYRPKSAEGGPAERSLAVRLELLDEDATLTDERIDAAVRSVLDTLSSRLGARLRG